MKNYIESNLDIVNFYKECYKEKIDVGKIIKVIEEEKFLNWVTRFSTFYNFP